MKWSLVLLALLTSVLLIPPGLAQTSDRTAATVISTGDGDTLSVNQQGQAITVRLACTDAPENNQLQGPQSAQQLAQLLFHNIQVQPRVVDVDRYGRTVAEVYRNGQSVNLQMVQEGRAVMYRQYLDDCTATRDRYLQVKQQTLPHRLAFWSQSNPAFVYQWRNFGR